MTIDVEVVETSSLGDRSYLAHDGQVAVVVDPQRDIDRVLALAGRPACGSPTWWRPTSTTTTSPAGWRWPGSTGAAYLVTAGRRGRRSTGCRCADGDVVAVGEQMRLRVVATPGAHVPPPVLRARRTPAGRCRRCSPAGRCCSAPPAAPTCSASEHAHDAGPRPVRLGAPAGRRAARRRAGLAHPRVRQLLLGHPADAAESTIGREQARPTRR